MRIEDYIEDRSVLKIPEDVRSIDKIIHIAVDGTQAVYYNGGSDVDIYSGYIPTSSKKFESSVTLDKSRLDHYSSIPPESTVYRYDQYRGDMVTANYFQMINYNSTNIYVSIYIPKSTKTIKFIARDNSLLGQFTLRREGRTWSALEYYMRLTSEFILDDHDNPILMDTILTDDNVRYIGGTSIGQSVPDSMRFLEDIRHPKGIITKDTVGLKSDPYKIKITNDTGVDVSKIYNWYDYDHVYENAIYYMKGDYVIIDGKKYESLINKNINNYPPHCPKVWKKIN